jgi:hypothetical protein
MALSSKWPSTFCVTSFSLKKALLACADPESAGVMRALVSKEELRNALPSQ